MNKPFIALLFICMGGGLNGADFSASLAQVNNVNNSIIVTDKPTGSRYTAYIVLSLNVAAMQAYISEPSITPAHLLDLQIANYTQEFGLSLHNNSFIIQEGNYYTTFAANLSISLPANVSTTLEQIDKIFTADVTHAALTFSYSSVGTLAYLSLAKEDGSVIYYADMNDSVKSQSSKKYVEAITFNPDYIISADVYVKDNLKGLPAASAFELNENHLYTTPPPLHTTQPSQIVPEPAAASLSILSLSLIFLRHRRT